MRRLLHPLVALLAAFALVATGCSSDDSVTVTAEFPDVLDLVEQAMVRTNGVRTGTVTGIELTDDNVARVTMDISTDSGLPADVRAELRQTNLLGERYIELVPLEGGGTLASGSVAEAAVVGDLEDLILTGSELFGLLSAERLSAMIQAGAITFGGRGGTIGGVITDFEVFIGTVEADRQTILDLIDNLHAFVGTLSEQSDINAESITVLARNAAALSEEDDRLVDALTALTDLNEVGGRILREHRDQIDSSVRRLRRILEAITGIEGALQNFLTWLPRHNLHVPNGILEEMAQLWNDDIDCDSHEDTGNPAEDCTPPNPGERGTPPPYPLNLGECVAEHENCGYPEGTEPRTSNDTPEEDDD